MSTSKLKIEFKKEYFAEFVSKIQDLSQISDIIKVKFERDHILAYSLVASDVAVLCLKSYILETSKYLTGFKDEHEFDLVISSSSKFVKNLRFFDDFDIIRCEMIYKPSYENPEIMHIRALNLSTPAIKGDRLRITFIGAELSKIRELNRQILEKRMDPKMSKWNFKLVNNDLLSIKKMSNINSDDKVLSILIEKNLVYFTEDGKWNLQIGECSYKDTKIIFNKKYLSNINSEAKEVDFKIFETFILISDSDSRLLLSFETDFTTDD